MMAEEDSVDNMRKRILDVLSPNRLDGGPSVRTDVHVRQPRTSAEDLLRQYREAQSRVRVKKSAPPVKKTYLVDVCRMEMTVNKISWKRASQLVKVGTICSSDNLTTTKEKCARALAMTESVNDLLLIVRGAVLDSSAFITLEGFLNALSPQQRSHLVLGVGVKPGSEVNDDGSSEGSVQGSSSARKREREADSVSSSSVKLSCPPAGSHPHLPTVPQISGIATYSYEELYSATDEKSSVMRLGRGGFGDVFMGRLRHTLMAIKFFRSINKELYSALDSLVQEAAILTSYRHPNLVSIFGVCKDPEHPAICYELMEYGSLWECVMGKCKNGLYRGHIEQRVKNLYEASCGLAFLHSSEGGLAVVTHGDVKTTNILLSGHFVAKLGDFGFARVKPECEGGKSFWRAGEACGTQGYMAPEVASGEVSPKVDIYAFGVVILEVYSELEAFDKRRSCDRQTLHEVFDEALDDVDKFAALAGNRLKEASARLNCDIPYAQLQHLARSCLQYPKFKRASTGEIVDALEELAHSKLVRPIDVQ